MTVSYILLGYRDAEFGYKLWDPVKKKIIKSRDVTFNEHKMLLNFKISQKTTRSEGIPPLAVVSLSIRDAKDEGELYDEHEINDILAPNNVR